jgi:hypothetical protein
VCSWQRGVCQHRRRVLPFLHMPSQVPSIWARASEGAGLSQTSQDEGFRDHRSLWAVLSSSS